MANYCCTLRTNYFHVKDKDVFLDIMQKVYGCEGDIEVFTEKDENGNEVFGFGGFDSIVGWAEGDSDFAEPDYDAFIDKLQSCVADDDAIIIMEAGNEKLRYVVGTATVITSKDCVFIDAKELAIQEAAKLLGNPEWKTKCDY